jgi:hypothetical protein
MAIFIQIVILFILLMLYFSATNSGDSNNWGRSLILAVAMPLVGIAPVYFGILGWLVALIIVLVLISKLTAQSITGSLLFLIVIGLAQYVIQIGLVKSL